MLITPMHEHFASYIDALRRGYNDTHRPVDELIALIESSPADFLKRFNDPHAKAGAVQLPDGSFVPRLPGIERWMWDGEFCGSIGLRWSAGTTALPPYCLGHIGYSVVEWKRGRGHATAALAQILPEARNIGLPYVELVTNVDNVYSQRAILANGGKLVEQFEKPASNGGGSALRFRITL